MLSDRLGVPGARGHQSPHRRLRAPLVANCVRHINLSRRWWPWHVRSFEAIDESLVGNIELIISRQQETSEVGY